MNYKTPLITHPFVALLAVFVSFLFCFANTLQAAAMPGFERLQPVTANIKAPTAVALDIYGNIYVTESSTNRLLIYSQGGEHVETLSGLDKPISVAVDDDGRIFIGNSNKGNVEVYNAGLTLLFKLGTGDGEFTQPNAIAVDSAGDIYVADSKEDEINVYNPDGSYNFSFGGSGNTDGLFNFPTSIAIDEISGEIIISDLQVIETIEGARIQVFDMNGGFKRGFDAFGVGEGLLAKPLGVEVDEDGRIYVSDAYQNIVQVFDSDGTYLGTIYDLDNPLRTPLGMAFSKEVNKLFIASLNSVRVEVYGILNANITVTPASHDFGGVNVGDTSIAQTFTISNIGNGNLVTGTITIAGTDASEFSIQNDICSGQTIAPSESCTTEVVFSPTSQGTKSANLSIPSNDHDTPTLDVPLSGIGNTVPAADPNGPYTGIEGQVIDLDGSDSSDSDGSIVLYEWDINNNGTYDYSSSLPTRSHTYAQQGTYTIKLRVTDNLGATDAATTTATISDTSPTANFTGSPANGTAPLTVNFTNNSTGYDQPLSYEWDFDNNGTIDSADTNPSYTYSDTGTYTVKLTVTDSDGSADTLTRTDYITVALAVHTLTVEKAGTGTGTVTSSPAGIDCGTDCAEAYGEGTVVTLTATPAADSVFAGWSGGECSGTGDCAVTINSDITVSAIFDLKTYSLSCPDTGNIECLERTDSGDDSNNLDDGKPKVDIEYEFKVVFRDLTGNAPQYVKLYMTQRSNPLADDFYAYDMNCAGDWTTGATCTYTTKLGPAAVHTFYLEAKMSEGILLTYPDTGYITGPEVRLLTGYNLVGMPGDIGSDILDGNTAFGSTSTYRWNADIEYYTKVTTAAPVNTGEGYFVDRQDNYTLPELENYAEIVNSEFTYELKAGWNIISNPYSGNIRLSDIQVKKGNDTAVTWTEAVTNGWIVNAIYYYNGRDWGETYTFETEPDATLVPWLGYWVYLEMTDDTYYLVIPKP